MKEYIEREAAQKIICGWCGVCHNPTAYDLMRCDDICPQFAQIPAADVREVKRGFNAKKDYPSLFECSICGWECWDTIPCDTETFNFCPNCGAEMMPEPPKEET